MRSVCAVVVYTCPVRCVQAGLASVRSNGSYRTKQLGDRLQTITAVVIKCQVILDMTPSHLVNIYTDVSENPVFAIFRVLKGRYPERGAAGSSEMSVAVEQWSRRRVPGDKPCSERCNAT